MDQGKNMEEKVFSYIEQYRMIEAGDRVIAGGIRRGRFGVPVVFVMGVSEKGAVFRTGSTCKPSASRQ